MTVPLLIAKNHDTDLVLLPALANRHGLITGATGTGKTITLQVLAERFSAIGVPVFMADVKGDLSGLAEAGSLTPKMQARLAALGLKDWEPKACPVVFWDVYGSQGHPVRATISDMGPVLLARLLNLNETQAGTRRRQASSNSSSRSPTTRACSCSTSRTCARWSSTSAKTPSRLPPNTATSRPPRSAPSSATC